MRRFSPPATVLDHMPLLRSQISISLDGYVAGPNQSAESPLGEDGERLHDWVLKTASWRESHGYEGGEHGPDSDVMAAAVSGVGASIVGRKMFGGGDGP